ncbi:unnamed protein product [Cercopithifilaria johnstoni]|uniref:RING-type E3 ubiquitin transferase n=1 Tax=Cercopithifilaria johnstoni TaxID=2874296 RepID=A0A8J2MD55_9BILA|nr:unnamed protein product [Cercopithifilaria johnstoni]
MSTSKKRRKCHSKFKSDSVDEENSRYECSICYKEAVNPVVLSCGHFYCWECIDEWLNKYTRSKKQCPICKRRVRDGDVIPIYGKGIISRCENPRPAAPAQNREDDKDEPHLSVEDSSWTNFFKLGTVFIGLIVAFIFGRQTAKR